MSARKTLKDQRRLRTKVLEDVLALCNSQLDLSEAQLEELSAVTSLAKGPRERTSMNIVLDDQKKVIKSLRRLQSDLSELIGKSA